VIAELLPSIASAPTPDGPGHMTRGHARPLREANDWGSGGAGHSARLLALAGDLTSAQRVGHLSGLGYGRARLKLGSAEAKIELG